jgi:hypothetical protein
MTSTGVVQDAISLHEPGRSYPGGILVTLEIYLMFFTEAVYPSTGVSNENWGKVLW